MTRRSSKVALLYDEAISTSDHWTAHIELYRGAYATFSIWSKKYGEDPLTGHRRRFDLEKTTGLKSPLAIKKAIEDKAKCLNITVQWDEAIPLIASIDWLTAAVIASDVGEELPELPQVGTLLTQRSLRTLGDVTVGAEWGYDMHELTLPFERWVRILGGEHWSTAKPFWYEGDRFTATWSFNGWGHLEVSYDDCGVGWDGNLTGLDIIDGPKVDDVDVARLALRAVN
jgi:hypothetical protein